MKRKERWWWRFFPPPLEKRRPAAGSLFAQFSLIATRWLRADSRIALDSSSHAQILVAGSASDRKSKGRRRERERDRCVFFPLLLSAPSLSFLVAPTWSEREKRGGKSERVASRRKTQSPQCRPSPGPISSFLATAGASL